MIKLAPMKLSHGIHLAYCTNIHRGESWLQTLDSLNVYTLAVRKRVCPDKPYAIGLRLTDLPMSPPKVLAALTAAK